VPPTRRRREQAATPQNGDALSRQAWKLTSIIWCVLTRALLPFAVERLVHIIPNLVAHLDRTDSHAGNKQREVFREKRRDRLGRDVTINC
jgi:hypothetical protein